MTTTHPSVALQTESTDEISPSGNGTDFVAIGLSALATIAAIREPFRPEKNFKSDAVLFWEPELATFATVCCSVLARSGWRTALMTSLGDDSNGFIIRELLEKRRIQILFARRTDRTARQVSIFALGSQIRYNLDLQISRENLSDSEKKRFTESIEDLIHAKWIAIDKYELDIAREMFNSAQWQTSKAKPLVLFETGSRPLADTLAPSDNSGRIVELDLIREIDLFTTTSDWIIATASRLGLLSCGKALEQEDKEENFKRAARSLFPLILPEKSERPFAAIINLGPQGCYVILRQTEGENHYRVIHRPVKKAGDFMARLGAGDVFRASLIRALSPPFVTRIHGGVNPQDLLAAIDLAQYCARRWLERKPSLDNYFGSFPFDFALLRDNWRAEAALGLFPLRGIDPSPNREGSRSGAEFSSIAQQ